MTKETGKKRAAQKAWGLEEGRDLPMVIVPHLDEELLSIIEQILEAIIAVGLQVVFVNDDQTHAERLEEIRARHPKAIAIVSDRDAFSSTGDIEILHEVDNEARSRYEDFPRVPIAERGVELFDPIEEKGFGFTFDARNPWTLLVGLVRASETFRFPYDWKNLLRAVKKG